MKIRLLLFLLIALGKVSFCQADSQDPYSEKLVGSFVHEDKIVFSMQEKALNRLGDRAAIGLLRYFGTHSLGTPQEVGRVLQVVRMSFSAPQIIESKADIEPKATSVLLSYLSMLPASATLKAEIDSTRTSIQQQMNDYAAKQSSTKP